MLTNFIQPVDLQIFEPNVLSWVIGDNSPIAQIIKAGKALILDLGKMNKDSKNVMTAVYLNQGSVYSVTDSLSEPTEDFFGLSGIFNRIVVDKFSCTVGSDSEMITLDGETYYQSNEFENVASIALTTGSGLQTVVLNKVSHRYVLNFKKNISINFSGKIYLVDTSFDDLICYKALELIFTGLWKSKEDMFYNKMDYYARMYQKELAAVPFPYDYNQDGKITEGEIRSSTTMRIGF